MTESERLFLIVAEEMSISKAAEKAFVSQQAMSAHISRLEAHYGVPLFIRRPRLALTQAGDRLAAMLRRIQIMETAFEKEIGNESNEVTGKLTVGITYPRATIILPMMLPEYRKKYPLVDVRIQTNVAENLENRLLFGYLDLAISTMEVSSPQLESTVISRETAFLVASTKTINSFFPCSLREILKRGLTMKEAAGLPLITPTRLETFGRIISGRFEQIQEKPNEILEMENPDLRCQLCGKDIGATFMPTLLLPYVIRQNLVQPPENKLHIIPISDFSVSYFTYMFFHSDSYQPDYVSEFISMYTSVSHDLEENMNRIAADQLKGIT